MTRQLTNRELRRLYQERFARGPVSEQSRHGAGWWFWTILSTLFVLAFLFVVAVEFILPMVRPEGIVIQSLAQRTPAATTLPTLPPRPTTPPYQPPPPAAPQEVAPVIAPAPPAPVIVVTPTYSTGCHDGVSYVDGVATNGTCAGAAFAGELPTATPEPTATIAPATAVPPDAVYLETIRNQAPHCIRCAP